jgi:hypothetical protein
LRHPEVEACGRGRVDEERQARLLRQLAASDIAEDFNLSGRGKSRFFSLRSVGPRPLRLKVECTKPLLDLAGQLLNVH